jgi:hypothetical protein
MTEMEVHTELSASAPLSGHITHVTMTFFNDTHQVLEGSLEFTLPAEAVVCGFALDVEEQMVEGVIVEKEKARVAFEAEVRKGLTLLLVLCVFWLCSRCCCHSHFLSFLFFPFLFSLSLSLFSSLLI